MRLAPFIATVVVMGCQTKQEAPTAAPEPPAATSDGAPIAVTVDATPATVQQQMTRHFATVVDVQRAIMRGHLDKARDSARLLVAYEEPAIEGGAPFVAEMRRAAEALIAANDLPTAAVASAGLGRTCSRCHEATSAVIAFAWEPEPEPDPSLRVQMLRHQWAAARLWEGLVGPSNEMWIQGSEALATAKLDLLAAGRGVARGDLEALATNVHVLAERAKTTTDHGARATLYGALLSTCAGCHQLVRPGPAPL
jgi:hypothetical protein